tara:strand:- start:592 stop:933 length:342 start_codon:yes stop_codon:yes gene_type:complete
MRLRGELGDLEELLGGWERLGEEAAQQSEIVAEMHEEDGYPKLGEADRAFADRIRALALREEDPYQQIMDELKPPVILEQEEDCQHSWYDVGTSQGGSTTGRRCSKCRLQEWY